tara:strand:+ start:16050 stop:17039 length:990 start_codon:yes stop_codon:yes gene_type:complete
MKKIFFHVGLPKTGTTYIQRKLANNRSNLEKYNIAYHQIDQSICDCHWWFATNFFTNPESYSSVKIDLENGQELSNLIARGEKSKLVFSEEISKYSRVILSAEQFFFLPENVLIRIKNFFAEHEAEVKVILYVRDFYDLAISEVNQKVKMGMGDLDELLENLPVFRVKDNIEKFSGIFGKGAVVIRNFTSLRFEGVDLVDDFISLVTDEKVTLVDIEKESNSSLSNSALRIIDNINKNGFSAPPHSKERDILIGSVALLNGQKIAPKSMAINDFYKKVGSDIEYLKNNFGIRFQERKAEYLDSYEGNKFSESDITKVLSFLVGNWNKNN